jgi:hypothetical protein
MIWMAAVGRGRGRDGGGDGGSSGSDDKNNRNSEGSGRNSANWEVGQIKGTNGEGTMF